MGQRPWSALREDALVSAFKFRQVFRTAWQAPRRHGSRLSAQSQGMGPQRIFIKTGRPANHLDSGASFYIIRALLYAQSMPTCTRIG